MHHSSLFVTLPPQVLRSCELTWDNGEKFLKYQEQCERTQALPRNSMECAKFHGIFFKSSWIFFILFSSARVPPLLAGRLSGSCPSTLRIRLLVRAARPRSPFQRRVRGHCHDST